MLNVKKPRINFDWDKKMGPCATIYYNGKNHGLCLCHRREDRSFKFYGHVFPVCARGTGILAGFTLALLLNSRGYSFSAYYAIVLIVPLLIDGFSQSFGRRESTNLLRLITGICFGIGLMYIGGIVK